MSIVFTSGGRRWAFRWFWSRPSSSSATPLWQQTPMGTACVCAPLIPRASSDSRPSAPCPSPGAGLDALHQYPQRQCDLSRLSEKYVPDRERSPPPPPHRRSQSRSGRLLHEPRGLLAKGCVYCTNPRTPRTTPNPPPVTPDLRALRPEDAESHLGDRIRAQTNPRQPNYYRGLE